jgi:hypothetical protein
MSSRTWLGIGLIWIASLGVVGAWPHAQVIVQRPDLAPSRPAPPPPPPPPPPVPFMVTGTNVGFRVTGFNGDKPVGRWVVRTSAYAPWVEPDTTDK